MQLTVRDVARLLNALEHRIYDWIREDRLPAYRLRNQFRFNRAELLEWATSQKLEISSEIFKPAEDEGAGPLLSDALRAGGIFYGVEGTDKKSVLRSVVAAMQLPPGVDRGFLLSVLLAQAVSASTPIFAGVAVPHVRNPLVLHVRGPMLTLCFLAGTAECGARDGQHVFAIFSLISPTVRTHLYVLSRLAFALHDPGFRAVLEQRGSGGEILSQLGRIEARLAEPPRGDESAEEAGLVWPF
jgi:PTS system nitrogen regulatory IIA component